MNLFRSNTSKGVTDGSERTPKWLSEDEDHRLISQNKVKSEQLMSPNCMIPLWDTTVVQENSTNQ